MAHQLYHGSFFPDIQRLRAQSADHDHPDKRVVYMTSNRAYALFYIWDPTHNQRQNKYVTAGIKDGIVCYHEQFPNQLKTFYDGVSGYLYSCKAESDWFKASKPETWLCSHDVTIETCERIENVYEEILQQEALGNVRVFRFDSLSPENQAQTVQMIADLIVKRQYLLHTEEPDAIFFATFYKQAWAKALQMCENA